MLSHFSHAQLFAILWTIAPTSFSVTGFSRWKYWSGLPCPSPGNLPDPGIKLTSPDSPALAGRFFTHWAHIYMGFPGGSDGKESACNVGDLGLIYILAWRSPMDRRPWWATVHGVAKSWTQLTEQSSMHTYIHTYIYIYTHTHLLKIF